MSYQKYTPLLHGFKDNKAYDELKSDVFKTSNVIIILFNIIIIICCRYS